MCWALILGRFRDSFQTTAFLLPAPFPECNSPAVRHQPPMEIIQLKSSNPFAEGFLFCGNLAFNALCLPHLEGPVEDPLHIPFLKFQDRRIKTSLHLHTHHGALKHCLQSCFTFIFPTANLKPLPSNQTMYVCSVFLGLTFNSLPQFIPFLPEIFLS